MCAHALVGPLIRLGVEGLDLTTVKLLIPLNPQSLTACTVMALVLNPPLKLTVMSVSFTPGPSGWVTVVVPACEVQI
jgi:hypothetical protein